VFMSPARGRRAGGIGGAIRREPKWSAEAQREVRDLVVAMTCRESGAIRAQAARNGGADERTPRGCEGGPQKREREAMGVLSTRRETR
jgi:hypothetical protein